MATQKVLAKAVLDLHGTPYSDEIGIKLSGNTPSPLYRWLVAATLFSARISQDIAVAAAKALSRKGWRTPEKMAAATWRQRTDTLNHAGYARYDESTSRMLGEGAQMLVDRYDGDLRKLRQAADRDPKEERAKLKAFKGIGDTGADIFFREVQLVWDEHFPFADNKALKAAAELGLPDDAAGLAGLVPKGDFVRLVSGLVRTDLAKDYDKVRDVA